jgi:hypothetical protein
MMMFGFVRQHHDDVRLLAELRFQFRELFVDDLVVLGPLGAVFFLKFGEGRIDDLLGVCHPK